eukprot:406589_1
MSVQYVSLLLLVNTVSIHCYPLSQYDAGERQIKRAALDGLKMGLGKRSRLYNLKMGTGNRQRLHKFQMMRPGKRISLNGLQMGLGKRQGSDDRLNY